jgi:hypothetical protein
LAIDYIIGVIAPLLHELDPSIRIDVLGADAHDVEEGGMPPNIRLMGYGTSEDARNLFVSGDLLVCPIQNKFGQKFKIAEAVSYAAPFLASQETMLGYPYLSALPSLNLDDPKKCISMIIDLLNSPNSLKELSMHIRILNDKFIQTQKNVWRRIFYRFDDES